MYKDLKIEILSSLHPEYRRCVNCHAPFHILKTAKELRDKFSYMGTGLKLKMCFICFACIRPQRFFGECLGIKNLHFIDNLHDIIKISKKRKGLYFPGTILNPSVFCDTSLGKECIKHHG